MRIAGTPAVRRIALLDAPAALGWDRWREIEQDHGLKLLKAGLAAITGERAVPPDLVDVFAHALLASLNEIALLVAQAPDVKAAQRAGVRAVDELLGPLVRLSA